MALSVARIVEQVFIRDLLVEKDGILSFTVRPGLYEINGQVVSFAGAIGQTVLNNTTTFVWVDAVGLQTSTVGYPVTPHVRLARVVATGGTIIHIEIERVFFSSGAGASVGEESLWNCTASEQVLDAVFWFAPNEVRRANATSLATSPARGFIVAKPTVTTCIIRYDGELSGFSALTAGATHFLSKTSDGQITSTAPSAPSVRQRIGFAKNSSTLVINLDEDFVLTV